MTPECTLPHGLAASRLFAGDGYVAVRVDSSVNSDVPPFQGDFTMFGAAPGRAAAVIGPLRVDILDHGGPDVYMRQSLFGLRMANLDRTAAEGHHPHHLTQDRSSGGDHAVRRRSQEVDTPTVFRCG